MTHGASDAISVGAPFSLYLLFTHKELSCKRDTIRGLQLRF
jgi:hypothetical protein